jgi:hypothetical protein
VDKGQSSGALLIKRAAREPLVIYNENVDDVQVPLLEHAGESRIALKHMSVRVNGMKWGECLPRLLGSGRLTGTAANSDRSCNDGKAK